MSKRFFANQMALSTSRIQHLYLVPVEFTTPENINVQVVLEVAIHPESGSVDGVAVNSFTKVYSKEEYDDRLLKEIERIEKRISPLNTTYQDYLDELYEERKQRGLSE